MVDKSRRQELRQQFDERPPQNGVFALKSAATGETWVGVTRNIDTQKNGLWMRLANNQLLNKDAQAAWNSNGEAAFSYEILERFTETDPNAVELLHLERTEHWRKHLDAGVVKGT